MALCRLFDHIELELHALHAPPIDRASERSSRDPIRDGAPDLGLLKDEDLDSVASLRILYRQAVGRALVAESEAGLVNFLSTAAYCRRVGRRPAALFAHLVRRRLFPATLRDEDRAYADLKRHLAAERGSCRWLVVRPPDLAPEYRPAARGGRRD